VFRRLIDVFLLLPQEKEPSENLGMKRFDASVENFRETRER